MKDCTACKAPGPCRRLAANELPHGQRNTYLHGCRCLDCRLAASRAKGRDGTAILTVDDGIVDEVVVERLLAGVPTASTRRERLEAARVAYGREGWHELCKRLGINSARARQITSEVSA